MRRLRPSWVLLAALLQCAPAWSDEAIEQVLKRLELSIHAERVGNKITVDITLHNVTGHSYGYIDVACTALDIKDEPLHNGSNAFEHVQDGETVSGMAVIDFDENVRDVRCQVVKLLDKNPYD